MDLNQLYLHRQTCLERAATTDSRLARTKHLAAAGLAAYRIEKHHAAEPCHGSPKLSYGGILAEHGRATLGPSL